MRRLAQFALLVCFWLGALCFAQTPAPPIITIQATFPVSTNLTPVNSAAVQVVGNPGPQTYYYWTVATYSGNATSPTGPWLAANAPNTLSVSNYDQIIPNYPAGASVDVLRTSSPTPPTGACNCAVATGVTSGTVNDQSNALLSYTVTPFIPNNFPLALDNEVIAANETHLILRQGPAGTFVVDLSLAGGGGGGNVSGPATAVIPDLACWNSTSGTLLSDCGVALPLPNTSLQHASLTVNGVSIALGASGTITAVPSGSATGDVFGTYPGPLTVGGVNGVPLCTGFTPLNGQALEYTTGGSPNPCYTAGTAGSLTNPMTTLGDFLYGGLSGTPTRLAGATSPNGVPEFLTSNPSGGVATAPVLALPGIVGRSVTGATDTIASADCNPKRIAYTGTAAVAVTLPTPTTLAVPNCSFKIANNTTNTATVTPTTWTISAGSGGTPGATLAILEGQEAILFVDPTNSSNWAVDVLEQGLLPGTGITFVRSVFGVTINSTAPTLNAGVQGEPAIYPSTAVTPSPSALYVDASVFGTVGTSTADVFENACTAWIKSIGGGKCDLTTAWAGVPVGAASRINFGRLLPPTLTAVATGTGTPYTGPVTVKGTYRLISTYGNSDESEEGSVAIASSCTNCFAQWSTPPYAGLATQYQASATTGNSWTEQDCSAATAIGSSAAFGQCAGANISLIDSATEYVLPPQCNVSLGFSSAASGANAGLGVAIFNRANVHGAITGSSPGCQFTATSSTNLTDLVGYDNNQKNDGGTNNAGSQYIHPSGFQNSVTNPSATVTNALDVHSTGDSSSTELLSAINANGVACNWWALGYSFFIGPHCDGFANTGNTATGIPASFGQIGAQESGAALFSPVFVHPGYGQPTVRYVGGNFNLWLYSPQIETNVAIQSGQTTCNKTAPIFDLGTGGAQGGMVGIYNPYIGADCAAATHAIVQFESTMTSGEVTNMNYGGVSTVAPINNLASGYSNTVSTFPKGSDYFFGGRSVFDRMIEVTSGNSLQVDSGASISCLSGSTCPGGSSAPGWLTYYGDGSDGASTVSTNTNLSGIKYYTTFALTSGAVLTANTSNAPLIIRATTSITICATCSIVATGNSTGFGDSGGTGGGGGGGGAAGTAGDTVRSINGGSYQSFLAGGTAGAVTGGTGGNGNATGVGPQRSIIDAGIVTMETNIVGGAIGGAGGSSGGAGGNGGGVIILIAPSITLASGAALTSNGANGTAGGSNTGGGGGGGGGVILVRSPGLTDSGAVFSTAAGSGGAAGTGTSGAGGNGGAGWHKEITQ